MQAAELSAQHVGKSSADGTSSEKFLDGLSNALSGLSILVFECRRGAAQKLIYDNRALSLITLYLGSARRLRRAFPSEV